VLQLQEGFAPWPLDRGLCLWTPLGALHPDPRNRLALYRARHGEVPPDIADYTVFHKKDYNVLCNTWTCKEDVVMKELLGVDSNVSY